VSGGGVTRPLPRDGECRKISRRPNVEPHPKAGLEIKKGSSSAKDCMLERLGCRTIQNEVS